MTRSSQEQNSKIINYKNSEALKMGLTQDQYPLKHCKFCGKDLEVIGFYMSNTFFNHWITQGKYEKCNCEQSKEYWRALDEEEERRKVQEIKERQKQEYQERLSTLIKKSHLGERFRKRTFNTFKINKNNKEFFETCLKYAERFSEIKEDGTGIILSGSCGVGKTHLAAAIAHELMKQGYQPIFGTLISLLERVKSTYNTKSSKETDEEIINSYINCSLLIIDDLGKEKPSEWTLEKLYQVLNARYEDNKPIIITTNYSMDKLIERLTVNNNNETAEATVSRIYEMCQGINMQGNDYRKL